MRILHVNKFLYRRGGAEAYMLDVAAHQRAQGHDVRLFGMDHPANELDHVLGPLPSHVEFEPAPPGATDRLRLLGRMLWSREVRADMAMALQQWQPDVIHCHNIYHQLSPSVLQPASDLGIPVVLTMHDYKLVCPTYQFLDQGEPCTACVEGGPWQAARRRCKDGSIGASTAAALEVWSHRRLGAYASVRRFIAPSRFLAGQVEAAGVFRDRIMVLDNFTDLDTVPVQTEPGRGAVFSGRLSFEKGVDDLIHAVAKVARTRQDSRPLLNVAGEGPDGPALQRMATELAPGAVRFHGRLPKKELRALIRSSAVAVVPSRWYENQPLAVLESFASGVPVIATDMGGLPELVTHGDVGWLVPASEPTRLADAITEALGDPLETRRRGERARRLALSRFSPSQHLAALEVTYRHLEGQVSTSCE